MSSKDKKGKPSTPPEVFALKNRSMSRMEERDGEQDDELKRIVERSASKKRVERASNSELDKRYKRA
ncbi:hypothetical protein BC830DRAFT_1173098 [Chytriomyces sp. MP71]|nr:hypothetical protein BC830DRAFT_1173098 [Chytriomyces sp. MP71]